MFEQQNVRVMILCISTSLIFLIFSVGIFGEVLFWTLRVVLGPDDYDLITHTAWIKFYSRILDVVVPIVLTHEISQSHMVKEFNAKRLMPVIATLDMVKQGIVDDEQTRSL